MRQTAFSFFALPVFTAHHITSLKRRRTFFSFPSFLLILPSEVLAMAKRRRSSRLAAIQHATSSYSGSPVPPPTPPLPSGTTSAPALSTVFLQAAWERAEREAAALRDQLADAEAKNAGNPLIFFWLPFNSCQSRHFFSLPALSAQLQEFHEAATSAITRVHARGDSVAAQLADLCRRVDQIALFGVEEGAALALSLAHLKSEVDFSGLDPHPTAGFTGDLEQLRKAHMAAASGIAAGMNPFSVISRVLELDD